MWQAGEQTKQRCGWKEPGLLAPGAFPLLLASTSLLAPSLLLLLQVSI